MNNVVTYQIAKRVFYQNNLVGYVLNTGDKILKDVAITYAKQGLITNAKACGSGEKTYLTNRIGYPALTSLPNINVKRMLKDTTKVVSQPTMQPTVSKTENVESENEIYIYKIIAKLRTENGGVETKGYKLENIYTKAKKNIEIQKIYELAMNKKIAGVRLFTRKNRANGYSLGGYETKDNNGNVTPPIDFTKLPIEFIGTKENAKTEPIKQSIKLNKSWDELKTYSLEEI